MKRFRKFKNHRNVCGAFTIPYKKDKKNKNKPDYGSLYFKVSLERPKADTMANNSNYQKLTQKAIRYDEYLVELDNHKNAPAHFHIWRADGYEKISGTRSLGIDLKTNLNEGIVSTAKEHQKEATLNDIQTQEILSFVEENRLLLYLMFKAYKMEKVKEFASVDEDYIESLFSENELYALTSKYQRTYLNEGSELVGSEPLSY